MVYNSVMLERLAPDDGILAKTVRNARYVADCHADVLEAKFVVRALPWVRVCCVGQECYVTEVYELFQCCPNFVAYCTLCNLQHHYALPP